MSQFIKAIEIDQTPVKMMSQWSSELAAEANIASQRQQALLKMKQDQDNLIASRYGELTKLTLDQTKELTDQQRNQLMGQVVTTLSGAVRESNGDPNIFYKTGMDKVLKQVSAYKSAVEKSINAAKERLPQLEAAGIRKDAVENVAKQYILNIDPSKPFSEQDFNRYIDQEIADNPQVYLDKQGLLKDINERIKTDGFEVDRSIKFDPTGKRKLTAGVKTKLLPWETLDELELPNKLKVSAASIKTEPQKVGDQTKNIVTEDVYTKFVGENPRIGAGLILGAKETIHDVNAKIFKVNTAAMSKQQFEAAQKSNPNLINPYDEGVIKTYARNSLTDILGNRYDEKGFSNQGKRDYEDVMDNPPKTTFNINNGKDVPVIDQYQVYSDAIKTGPKIKKGNKVLGTPLNMLESGQDYLIETANKVGKKDEYGQAIYDQSNLILTQGKGKIELRKWDAANQAVGDVVSVISKTPTNVKANQPLGTKSKQKVVAPAKSGISWK